ncbi:MAG: selenide, water dikinase SelD [Candidatus Omnitrophica bacterium]|nr:selenide, water dikinase SelD [Candidatus Omnitrophota bacterium]
MSSHEVLSEVGAKKRSRVMTRSMKLGYCICDVNRQCPCDMLISQDICPCAGERPAPGAASEVRLTALSTNMGCASKINATDLEGLLVRLPQVNDPAVLSGLAAGDDAGVYRLNESTTLVQTVDVFTPCVDDPYVFGKICAANCLSDIYAMGAVPRTALSILAFPSETHDKEIMYQMLKGAMEVLKDAGCALLGGHSIKDKEVKLGFSITGTIDATKVVSLETARSGDVLVLTKPLGVGVLSFAQQIGRTSLMGLPAAHASMMELNQQASEAMVKVGVSACTDITGFGLFGHLLRMLRHSGVSARIYADALPSFAGVLELLREGVIPGAMERNEEFVAGDLVVGEGVAEEYKYLGLSAETSGGLMIAVPRVRHPMLLQELATRGVLAATIGEICSGRDTAINLVTTKYGGAMSLKKNQSECVHEAGCCSDVFGGAEARPGVDIGSTVPGSMKAFGDLIASVTATGKIDKRVKELILFALVVKEGCEACLDMHYGKALGMGITPEELDEAAWCAVLIGGAPVKMAYGRYLASRKSREQGQ